MKKLITLAMVIVLAALFASCDGGGNTNNDLNESSDPTPSDMMNPSPTAEPAETTSEDVKTQMAGFWRMDWPNPDNAVIMILSADGSWESPGPLPTDYTDGGSFVITSEESGIYQLRLTIEHTSSPHTKIGSQLEDYTYDAPNDRIGVVLHSGEGAEPVWFTRDEAPAPRDFVKE